MAVSSVAVLRARQGIYLDANASARRLLGLDARDDAAAGRKVRDLLGAIDPRSLEAWLAGDGANTWIGVIRPQAKSQCWVRLNRLPAAYCPDGTEVLLIEDVTLEKEAEQATIKTQEHFHALIERSAEGISILDACGGIIYESPSNKRIHGYDAEEMNGRTLMEFCHPDDRARVFEVLLGIAEKPGNVGTAIVRFLCKDGHYAYLEGTVLNQLDDPRINGMVNNFRDVTERVAAEAELKLAKETAEQATRLQSRFLANLSHELKTPLTLIQQPLADLQSRAAPGSGDTEDRLWDMVSRNIARLENLISELIDLSLIEAGRVRLQVRRIDLAEFVARRATLFESAARERGVGLDVAIDEPCMIYCDAPKLSGAVDNLLMNALKFTDSGGMVTVRVGTESDGDEEYGCVTIADTGRGMSEETCRHVFDRFYQADAADNREFGGMGVGLAIAKEMAEIHGGDLSVKSRLGRGSTFTIRIPLGADHLGPADIDLTPVSPDRGAAPVERPTHAAVTATAGEAAPPSDSAPRLLLVEDSADMREYLQLRFSPRYRVWTAENGIEALALLEGELPDIVVSDVMMPRMDGLSLCRTLKADPRFAHLPVLLLSAKSTADQRVEGLDAGADDYVAKPFSTTELERRIERLLPKRCAESDAPSANDRLRSQVEEIIATHMGASSLGVAELARKAGYSERQFHRIVIEHWGTTPVRLLLERRLEHAAQLIEAGAFRTVAEVAAAVGLSASYFSRAYRARFNDAAPFPASDTRN